MPPDAPEPMIRTSYARGTAMGSACLTRGCRRHWPMPPGASAAGRGAAGVPFARVQRRGADVGLGLAQEARHRVGGRDERPRLPQRRHQRLDLRRLQRGEGLLELLLGLLLQPGQALAVIACRSAGDCPIRKSRNSGACASSAPGRPFSAGRSTSLSRFSVAISTAVKKCGAMSPAASCATGSSRTVFDRGGRLLLERRRRRRGRSGRRRRRRLLDRRLRQRRRGDDRRRCHGGEELPSLHRLPAVPVYLSASPVLILNGTFCSRRPCQMSNSMVTAGPAPLMR